VSRDAVAMLPRAVPAADVAVNSALPSSSSHAVQMTRPSACPVGPVSVNTPWICELNTEDCQQLTAARSLLTLSHPSQFADRLLSADTRRPVASHTSNVQRSHSFTTSASHQPTVSVGLSPAVFATLCNF